MTLATSPSILCDWRIFRTFQCPEASTWAAACEHVGGEDGIALMGERACVDGLVELRPRLAHRRTALVEGGDREPAR
jgi:hypothetical protein